MTRVTAAVAGLLMLAGPAAAQTYDAAVDFSTTSNPNGVWTYGYEPTAALGGSLTTYTNTSQNNGAGFFKWTINTGGNVPFVAKNLNATDFSTADTTVRPGQMALHADTGTASVVRFTAPAAGSYSVAATFSNQTTNRGQNVYVYVDGTQVFATTLADTFEASASYSPGSLTLAAGSTVDFLDGVRNDGSSNSTTVGLAVLITPVPEPAAVLAVAAVGLATVRRWRQASGR